MDNPKFFNALLNGVAKRVFDKDTNITPQFLQEQVFAANGVEVSVDEVAKMVEMTSRVFTRAAFENWEPSTLEEKLKASPLNDVQQELFVRAWKTRRATHHDSLVEKSIWNDRLINMQWRLDVNTAIREFPGEQDANKGEPVAIVELLTGKNKESDNHLVRFEIGKEKLSEVVKMIGDIEERLATISHGGAIADGTGK